MEESGKIGDVGSYDVTVDAQGNVVAKVSVLKSVDGVNASVSVEVDLNILKLAEAIAEKTATTWDDTAVKVLESLLGLVK